MTLAYAHKIPGEVEAPKAERLRTWDDSSPYHKGRPKRGPRGAEVLGLIERDFGWQKIPRIEEVTVHSMVKGAIDDIAYLHVAGMLLQSITGAKPEFHKAKKSIAAFRIRDRMSLAVTCTMRGGQSYDFVDKMVNLVFPRLKEWPGIKGKFPAQIYKNAY
jgi:large subunit ribosomal protein L5